MVVRCCGRTAVAGCGLLHRVSRCRCRVAIMAATLELTSVGMARIDVGSSAIARARGAPDGRLGMLTAVRVPDSLHGVRMPNISLVVVLRIGHLSRGRMSMRRSAATHGRGHCTLDRDCKGQQPDQRRADKEAHGEQFRGKR